MSQDKNNTNNSNKTSLPSSIPSDLLSGAFVEFLKRSQIPQWSHFYTDLDALAASIDTNLNENSTSNQNLKAAFRTLNKYCVDFQLTVRGSFHDGWFMPPSRAAREQLRKQQERQERRHCVPQQRKCEDDDHQKSTASGRNAAQEHKKTPEEKEKTDKRCSNDDKCSDSSSTTSSASSSSSSSNSDADDDDEQDDVTREEAKIAKRLLGWLIAKSPTAMEEENNNAGHRHHHHHQQQHQTNEINQQDFELAGAASTTSDNENNNKSINRESSFERKRETKVPATSSSPNSPNSKNNSPATSKTNYTGNESPNRILMKGDDDSVNLLETQSFINAETMKIEPQQTQQQQNQQPPPAPTTDVNPSFEKSLLKQQQEERQDASITFQELTAQTSRMALNLKEAKLLFAIDPKKRTSVPIIIRGRTVVPTAKAKFPLLNEQQYLAKLEREEKDRKATEKAQRNVVEREESRVRELMSDLETKVYENIELKHKDLVSTANNNSENEEKNRTKSPSHNGDDDSDDSVVQIPIPTISEILHAEAKYLEDIQKHEHQIDIAVKTTMNELLAASPLAGVRHHQHHHRSRSGNSIASPMLNSGDLNNNNNTNSPLVATNLLFVAPLRRPSLRTAYTISNPAIVGTWVCRLHASNPTKVNDVSSEDEINRELAKLFAYEEVLISHALDELKKPKNINSNEPMIEIMTNNNINNYQSFRFVEPISGSTSDARVQRLFLPPSSSSNRNLYQLAAPNFVGSSSHLLHNQKHIMASFDQVLAMHEAYPSSPVAAMFNEITFALTTIHSSYRKIAKAFLKEVNKVTYFYIRQSEVISSAVATCVDAAKCAKYFSDRSKLLYVAAFREAYDALDLLQEYCEQNVVAITKAFDALEQAQKNHIVIEAADALTKLPFALTKNAGLQLLRGDLIDAFRRSYLVTRLIPEIVTKEDLELSTETDDAFLDRMQVPGNLKTEDEQAKWRTEILAMKSTRKKELEIEIPNPLASHEARKLLQNSGDGGGAGGGNNGLGSGGGGGGLNRDGEYFYYLRANDDGSKNSSFAVLGQLFGWWHTPRQAASFLCGLTLALVATAASDFFALDQPTQYIQNGVNSWFHFTITAIFPIWYVIFSGCLFVWEHVGVNYPFMFSLQSAWNPWELLRNAFYYLFWWALFAYAYCRRALQEQNGWTIRQIILDGISNATLTKLISSQNQNNNNNNFYSFSSYLTYTPTLPIGHRGQFADPACLSFFLIANSSSSSSNSSTRLANFTNSSSLRHSENSFNFNCEYQKSIFDDALGPSAAAWVFPYCIWPIFILSFFWFQFVMHDPRRKRWLLPTLARLVVTPYYKTIAFSEFMLCAMLLTLGTMWFELQFIWCYFNPESFEGSSIEGACNDLRTMRMVALQAVPILWRVCQCLVNYTTPPPAKRTFFPHGVNACRFGIGIVTLVCRSFVGAVRVQQYSQWLPQSEMSSALIDGSMDLYYVVATLDTCFKSVMDFGLDFGLGPFGQQQSPPSPQQPSSPQQTKSFAQESAKKDEQNDNHDDALSEKLKKKVVLFVDGQNQNEVEESEEMKKINHPLGEYYEDFCIRDLNNNNNNDDDDEFGERPQQPSTPRNDPVVTFAIPTSLALDSSSSDEDDRNDFDQNDEQQEKKLIQRNIKTARMRTIKNDNNNNFATTTRMVLRPAVPAISIIPTKSKNSDSGTSSANKSHRQQQPPSPPPPPPKRTFSSIGRERYLVQDPKRNIAGIRSVADENAQDEIVRRKDMKVRHQNENMVLEHHESSSELSSALTTPSTTNASIKKEKVKPTPNSNSNQQTFFGLWNIRPLLYPLWVYLVFVPMELGLRGVWIARWVTAQVVYPGAEWIPFVFALIDLIRRFIWLLFRVENEQVNNLELYKVTKAAPPLNLNANYASLIPSGLTGGADEKSGAAGEDNRLVAIWDSASNIIALKDTSIAIQQQQQNSSKNAAGGNDLSVKLLPSSLGMSGSAIDRFFEVLPQKEKLALCLIALPLTHRHPPDEFTGVKGEGKSRWFCSLSSELKVHVLLRRIGTKRTLNEYTATCF